MTTEELCYELAPSSPATSSKNGCFLFPAMAGLSPETVDLLGCLPIANVNAQLVDYLASQEQRRHTIEFACVFAADPFYDPGQMIDDLGAANISGIANLPSLGILDGRFAEVMSASGFDFQRELQCLEFAKRNGLRASAFIWNEQQGTASLQARVDQVIVHPGGFLRQATTPKAAAAATVALVKKLKDRAAGETPVLLYRHPALYKELSEAAALAEGTIVYRG
ncbi:MAG: phosphoenolpyruvate hydrolase family protein [Verrucomicrobia bacterium]|nr:phosphoenolpyruvate hydrolase family protein [Verrucomicrobiota bacterium]